ncbi:MAG: hypothetical protein H7840_18125, partial [Alphaproteobacteria bacterium]
SEVMGNALKGLENGLVGIADGTRTAKDAFRDMATSIMSDLTRMTVRQAITNPLAGLLGLDQGGGSGTGLIGNFFGNNSGSGWLTDLIGSFGLFHDGGVVTEARLRHDVGMPAAASVTAPFSLFAAAPRYHGGGVVGLGPDEVPIIARKGERVLTEAQQARSGSAPDRPVNVVMNITTPDAASFRKSQGQLAAEMARAVTRGRRNL